MTGGLSFKKPAGMTESLFGRELCKFELTLTFDCTQTFLRMEAGLRRAHGISSMNGQCSADRSGGDWLWLVRHWRQGSARSGDRTGERKGPFIAAKFNRLGAFPTARCSAHIECASDSYGSVFVSPGSKASRRISESCSASSPGISTGLKAGLVGQYAPKPGQNSSIFLS